MPHDRYADAEKEQEDLARDFLREAWATTPELLAKYRPPNYAASVDIMSNSAAYYRTKQFGGRFVEFVERAIVLALHGGKCGICHEPIVGKQYQVDHIVPLKSGGDHSYENTQPTHPRCHEAKSATE